MVIAVAIMLTLVHSAGAMDNPRFVEELESFIGSNDDIPNSGLHPPDCWAFAETVEDEEKLRFADQNRDHWLRNPCVLWVLKMLAAPYERDDFPEQSPMAAVWERLDWRHHPLRSGNHWNDIKEPVSLMQMANGFDEDERPLSTLEDEEISITFRNEGRDSWYRYGRYLGRADWTGDGRADLLIQWEENAARGTYLASQPVIHVTEGPGQEIQSVGYVEWLRENRDRVLRVLKNKA